MDNDFYGSHLTSWSCYYGFRQPQASDLLAVIGYSLVLQNLLWDWSADGRKSCSHTCFSWLLFCWYGWSLTNWIPFREQQQRKWKWHKRRPKEWPRSGKEEEGQGASLVPVLLAVYALFFLYLELVEHPFLLCGDWDLLQAFVQSWVILYPVKSGRLMAKQRESHQMSPGTTSTVGIYRLDLPP